MSHASLHEPMVAAARVREMDAKIPDALVTALRRLARDMAVPLATVLLAAHAKVLAALTGEREISIRYIADGHAPLPCALTTRPASWREMLLEVRRAELELLSHQDYPVAALRRELGLTKPSFESEFDPDARSRSEPSEPAVLWVGVRGGSDIVLRFRYKTGALDEQRAARIAGYHITALTRMVARPDAEHERQSLLSSEELRFQLHGLAGPQRTLPDRRLHELFEDRVRSHPDAIAAVHGKQHWTYRQLNARVNRLAHALLARGLRSEEVVAVVTERNLDWLAAVLAIFKAGGVYLPIEPHFPPDRIAQIVSRAGCRLVLTERGNTAMVDSAIDNALDGALDSALGAHSKVETLSIDAACEECRGDGDPCISVTPGQLAYIYFTSGSTGEPKGAMCEHAGMLNHVLAKIHDLGLREGDVVAQTAPRCFDISLWQLVSALLAGGRTLMVEQEAILDAARFVDTIAGGKVAVFQVVPSYLEVLLSYLEKQPERELPNLRCVSVTGEALKKELVERWFAARPGIMLLNAYGLTETSDDTNHEIMLSVPERERIPLGRPIQNVHVTVVDEHLSPVPLGAPGEIVFSGICVGRGYVNDPERTRQAFMADPHREGQRLYRSGDYGRWLPGGKLEFLGRRDAQVKISGFRIEIGEIENALSRLPGVRDGAVVVTERAEQGKRLVAFYAGREPLDADELRAALGETLPAYMMPSAFHWLERMPLTDNGKIDRKALALLAKEFDAAERGHARPRTATERRLAEAWARVLAIPCARIGRRDHFFDLGGTSLLAVKLAIALDRAVSIRDVTGNPVLADLGALIERRAPLSGR